LTRMATLPLMRRWPIPVTDGRRRDQSTPQFFQRAPARALRPNESASHGLAWTFSCNGRVACYHMRVTQTFEESQTIFTTARSSIRRKDWNFACRRLRTMVLLVASTKVRPWWECAPVPPQTFRHWLPSLALCCTNAHHTFCSRTGRTSMTTANSFKGTGPRFKKTAGLAVT
jgi:hypothetical protein